MFEVSRIGDFFGALVVIGIVTLVVVHEETANVINGFATLFSHSVDAITNPDNLTPKQIAEQKAKERKAAKK